jgi:hypothetical protein
MEEWLTAFYYHIGHWEKPVLSLIDNLAYHISGMEIEPPPPHIRIQFLPAKSTGIYCGCAIYLQVGRQPTHDLDQTSELRVTFPYVRAIKIPVTMIVNKVDLLSKLYSSVY